MTITDPLEHGNPTIELRPDPIEKVSIIVSNGSLEGVYPGLIMANGARMEGIEATSSSPSSASTPSIEAKHEHVKVATVGNPGLHLATWAGGFPGVSARCTHKLRRNGEARHSADPGVRRDDLRLGAGLTRARFS